MIVKESSWHAKAFRWMQQKESSTSFCNYWGAIFIGIPLVCCVFVMFLPAMPFVALGDWLEKKFKGKSVCPFGKVEIK